MHVTERMSKKLYSIFETTKTQQIVETFEYTHTHFSFDVNAIRLSERVRRSRAPSFIPRRHVEVRMPYHGSVSLSHSSMCRLVLISVGDRWWRFYFFIYFFASQLFIYTKSQESKFHFFSNLSIYLRVLLKREDRKEKREEKRKRRKTRRQKRDNRRGGREERRRKEGGKKGEKERKEKKRKERRERRRE